MALTSVIDNSNKVPGSYLKVSLGTGPRSAGSAPRKVLLYGNKLAGGSVALETATQVLTDDDANTLFGRGSELARMVRAALRVNRTVDLHATAITESAGTEASEDIVLGVGPASAAGTLEIWIGGDRVVAAIADLDSVTLAGDAVAAAINDNLDFPATAVNAVGTVTVTARHKGLRGNFIHIRTKLTGADTITHTPLNTYLSSGATADDPQTAIDNAQPVRYHYHVAPVEDATELAKFVTHVDSDADPTIGQRELVISASRDTLANATTLATGSNAERGQIAWLYNAEDEPSILAAALAAYRAKAESADAAANHDDAGLTRLHVPTAVADLPVTAELVSALNNGLTPLRSVNGTISIVRSITSHSQTVSMTPDFGVLDTHKVTVPDFVADDLDANWVRFKGFKAKDDDPDGEAPNPGVLTPTLVRDFIYERLKSAESSDLIVDVDVRKEEIEVELSLITDGRFDSIIPTDVIELAHQFAGDIRQIG